MFQQNVEDTREKYKGLTLKQKKELAEEELKENEQNNKKQASKKRASNKHPEDDEEDFFKQNDSKQKAGANKKKSTTSRPGWNFDTELKEGQSEDAFQQREEIAEQNTGFWEV